MLLNELFQIDEVGGVGVVAANKKMAADPRYSMSMTQDIRPGETQKQAKKFGNSVNKMGIPPKLKTNGQVSEAVQSRYIVHYRDASGDYTAMVPAADEYEARDRVRAADPDVEILKLPQLATGTEPTDMMWTHSGGKFGGGGQAMLIPRKQMSEATMSATIQGRNPVSAGARGLMAAKWKFRNNVDEAEKINMANAVESLAAKLPEIDHVNYESVDNVMQEICQRFQIDPKNLHHAFIKKYKLTPSSFSVRLKHERQNRPKSV